MRLQLLSPGKTKRRELATVIAEFAKRLNAFGGIDIVYTRAAGRGARSDGEKRALEGRELLAKIPAGALVIALDVQGRQHSSEEFAALLSKWEMAGRKTVSFVVGGHLGLAEEVRSRADLLLAFSKMTFPHELARLMLIEQIYRAYTIKAGTGYHK